MSLAARPPALTQADVPFMFDPNQCPSEVLGFFQATPGDVIRWDFGIYLIEDAVLDVNFVDAAGAGMVYSLTRPPGDSYHDPNADPVTGQHRKGYRFEWTPPGPGLYYIEVRVRMLDPNNTNPRITAASTDRRTLLVNVVSPPLKPTIMLAGPIRPTLFWSFLQNPDVDYSIRMRGAQELKKMAGIERAGRPLRIGELWGRL
jgi:hypothetical protein